MQILAVKSIAALVWIALVAHFIDHDIVPPHPIHLTVMEAEYNAKTQSLEISIRVFTDDLDLALQRAYNIRTLFVGTERENPATPDYLRRYLGQHLMLNVPGQPFLKQNYLGKDNEAEAVWLHIEVPNVPPFTALQIKNTLLLDLYDDHNNLVNVKANGQRQSGRTRRTEEEVTLKWD